MVLHRDSPSAKYNMECCDHRVPSRRELLGNLLCTGLPLCASQLSQFSILIVMFFFAGHLGVEELGSVSIALGVLNATGLAFSSGLCGALETLLSHSYGQDPRSPMYGVYAQRMFLVLMLFTIPLAVILGYIKPILMAIGEPAHMAAYVGTFCFISIFAMPPIMLLELLRRYYASQHFSNPFFVILAIVSLVHPLMQYILVALLGYNGIPIGWVILLVGTDVVLLVYLKISGLYRRTWGGWSKAAFQNWIPILKLAIPSLAMALSEWTAMEVNSVCAGFLTSVELGAYAISSQVTNLCWSTVSGFFMASTVLVGNCVGEGNPQLGKRYAILSLQIVLLLSCLNACVVYAYSEQIAYIFTPDGEVVSIFVSITPYFLVYHIFDSVQCTFLGILRGCGLHVVGAITVFLCLSIVGVPLGLYLLLHHDYNVRALWIGPVVGCGVLALPAYLFVFFRRVNWGALRPHMEERLVGTAEIAVKVESSAD